MKKSFSVFLFFLIAAYSFELSALPRFAVKLGDRCIDCHYNPSGGQMRTENGWHWGKNTLSMISSRDKDLLCHQEFQIIYQSDWITEPSTFILKLANELTSRI